MFLEKLTKKGLLILSKALYLGGIDEFSKDDIIGIILEIYEMHKVGQKFVLFIDKVEKVAITFDISAISWITLAIPVLDIHKYNKVIFDNESIVIKKGKKSYMISKDGIQLDV